MYKIMIVEDDDTIADALVGHLTTWNFETSKVNDFEHVTEQVKEFDPQLILLDIKLPYFNGFHWCTEIRKFSKVPIVFLSSASDNMNIVMAMNMGGDDFVAKPFDVNVLTAKIQAIFRRNYSFREQTNVLEYAGAMLNLGNTTVEFKGTKTDLTKNEFKILEILMENVGKIMSREKIMEFLWESDSYIDDNTLTVNVTRLRKKLEDIGLVDYILTKKGIGYYINEDI